MGEMIRREGTLRFPCAREALWALLADTDRLNRDLKLPPVAYSFVPRSEGGAYLRGAARFGPLTIRYEEEPYCWARPARWQVRRFAENGPVVEYSVGVTLDETDGGGVSVTAWCEAVPRGRSGNLVGSRVAESSVEGLLRACRFYAAHLEGEAETPHPRRSAVPLGSGESLAARLEAFLRHAPPEDVALFRPFALADSWGVDRRETVRTCLEAVTGGALELQWRLLCPACRGTGEPGPSLSELAEGSAHCPSCEIQYRPTLDRDVEVCFSVAPQFRKLEPADAATFCRGGPRRAAHVALQWNVPPESSRTVTASLPPGEYRLRSPQAREAIAVVVTSGEAREVRFDGGTLFVAETSSPGAWTLDNRAETPTLFCLDSLAWRSDAACAAEVTALQAFRKSFGSEVLTPGVEVSVRQIAILFTDLKDSTALYASRGDAPSYAAVRDHFVVLTELIEREGGGVIKTIGDAVMAVFPEARLALNAALAIQREGPDRLGGLTVKCGLHAGPALAIHANGDLDYFGQTVNLAARVQAHSLGGDVVMLASSLANGYLERGAARARAETFSVALKGIAGASELIRLYP